MAEARKLTFFCELPADELQQLFAGGSVVDGLRALGAGVSLGILDLSEDRAGVVHRLNRAGIPVTAWQLLLKEDGYWYNASNPKKAADRYRAFKAWTAEHRLEWAGIGIDIEFDRAEIETMLAAGRLATAWTLLKHLFDGQRLKTAERAYTALVEETHRDGRFVETYHIPILVDERRAGASVIKRLTGLIDLQADREVLMLYTSFLTALRRETRHAVLWSYGSDAQAIGIGSTGGGVDTAGADEVPPLSWAAFNTRSGAGSALDRTPIRVQSGGRRSGRLLGPASGGAGPGDLLVRERGRTPSEVGETSRSVSPRVAARVVDQCPTVGPSRRSDRRVAGLPVASPTPRQGPAQREIPCSAPLTNRCSTRPPGPSATSLPATTASSIAAGSASTTLRARSASSPAWGCTRT